ncbi:MAG: type II toxin-antitoxin system RatA family toxin [Gemmobacter sp.]
MPTHRETKRLPWSAAEMYALVADVERYPEFLPWCAAARVRTRRPVGDGAELMEAGLGLSFKVFREKFGSRVILWPERRRIETEYIDGPFRHMRSTWDFRDLDGGGCEVEFFVDFEFRNAILQGIIGIVFNEAMQRIVRAFEARAAALHRA